MEPVPILVLPIGAPTPSKTLACHSSPLRPPAITTMTIVAPTGNPTSGAQEDTAVCGADAAGAGAGAVKARLALWGRQRSSRLRGIRLLKDSIGGGIKQPTCVSFRHHPFRRRIIFQVLCPLETRPPSPPHPSPALPQAADMHRTFQRDLAKLRLTTARAYVKVLTDGQVRRLGRGRASCAVCSNVTSQASD